MYDYPCIHRGDVTGAFDCGCGLGPQPVHACNNSLLGGKGCVLRLGNGKWKKGGKDLLSCSDCDFREEPQRPGQPRSEPIVREGVSGPRPGDKHRQRQLREIGVGCDIAMAAAPNPEEWTEDAKTKDELTTRSTVESCMRLLEEQPGGMPPRWVGYDNIAEAFRRLMREKADSAPPAPEDWPMERGIVICGGGWKFFPSLYVTVRVIRATGCKLPIQVWYIGDWGEFDERMMAACRDYDVSWVNINEFARDNRIPLRVMGGWQAKPFSALYAPFKEVVCIDADCYPAYNPVKFLETPEYKAVGAAFWPDLGHVNNGKLLPGQWARFGLPYHDEPGWESGQYIVDKSRHWKPLWLTTWMNQHSDYVYKHMYGDKDTFHICWRFCGNDVCVPQRAPGWNQVAFLQKDFGNRTLFVHRTRDKFRLSGAIDGQSINNHYSTAQSGGDPRFVSSLPWEQYAHQYLRECDELLRPEKFYCFPDDHCRNIWQGIVLKNVYRAEIPRGGTVVDVGANVGAFAKFAFDHGARKVVCVEPFEQNAECIRKNVPRAEVVVAAVGANRIGKRDGSTADYSAFAPAEIAVESITLDSLLKERVDVLKLNCEGVEYSVLAQADLSNVGMICGEAHDWAGDPGVLYRMIESKGFTVETFLNGDSKLFRARKQC